MTLIVKIFPSVYVHGVLCKGCLRKRYRSTSQAGCRSNREADSFRAGEPGKALTECGIAARVDGCGRRSRICHGSEALPTRSTGSYPCSGIRITLGWYLEAGSMYVRRGTCGQRRRLCFGDADLDIDVRSICLNERSTAPQQRPAGLGAGRMDSLAPMLSANMRRFLCCKDGACCSRCASAVDVRLAREERSTGGLGRDNDVASTHEWWREGGSGGAAALEQCRSDQQARGSSDRLIA